jgi:hypothetical protein
MMRRRSSRQSGFYFLGILETAISVLRFAANVLGAGGDADASATCHAAADTVQVHADRHRFRTLPTRADLADAQDAAALSLPAPSVPSEPEPSAAPTGVDVLPSSGEDVPPSSGARSEIDSHPYRDTR